MTTLDRLKADFQTKLTKHPNLKLLILFGSRARGDSTPASDWNVAFLYDPDRHPPPDRQPFWFPGSDLLETLSKLLKVPEQAIDIVDLSNCSDIIAHFIARDGQVIYEKTAGDFAQFQQQALKTTEELKQYCYTQREKMRQTLQRWQNHAP